MSSPGKGLGNEIVRALRASVPLKRWLRRWRKWGLHGVCAMTMEVPGKRGDGLDSWMAMSFIDGPVPLVLCAVVAVDVGSIYRQTNLASLVLRVRRALFGQNR